MDKDKAIVEIECYGIFVALSIAVMVSTFTHIVQTPQSMFMFVALIVLRAMTILMGISAGFAIYTVYKMLKSPEPSESLAHMMKVVYNMTYYSWFALVICWCIVAV